MHPDIIKDSISKKTDEELIKIVSVDRDDYQLIAVTFAEEEIKKRNIDTARIEQLKNELTERRIKRKEVMNLKCFFGRHKWSGCKCEKCGKTQDIGHNYNVIDCKCIEKCSICNKEHTIEHSWNGCRCDRCGTIRDEGHMWNYCKCERCSKIRDEGHIFVHVEGKCIKICTICNKEREEHKWNGCKCERYLCGKVRDEQHKWYNDKCRLCGKISYYRQSPFKCPKCYTSYNCNSNILEYNDRWFRCRFCGASGFYK